MHGVCHPLITIRFTIQSIASEQRKSGFDPMAFRFPVGLTSLPPLLLGRDEHHVAPPMTNIQLETN